MNKKYIKIIKKRYKVIKKELISSYINGYIGKNTINFTLNDGTEKICDEILKNKNAGDAVVIIPVLSNGNLQMILESRPLTKEEVILEFPAGMVDEGESYKSAALRELKEETGLIPTKLEFLEKHYQDQGCSRAVITTFLAYNCKYESKNLDEGEKIETIEITKDELYLLIDKQKEIVDANTKIAAMTYILKKGK